MEIFYTHQAAKQLGSLPKAVQKRIAAKMRFYAGQKDPLKFAERLTNSDEGGFRFRIGQYRIIFDATKSRIYVLKIAKRDKAYE
jgi:mRNA interferase RelE/StbE